MPEAFEASGLAEAIVPAEIRRIAEHRLGPDTRIERLDSLAARTNVFALSGEREAVIKLYLKSAERKWRAERDALRFLARRLSDDLCVAAA